MDEFDDLLRQARRAQAMGRDAEAVELFGRLVAERPGQSATRFDMARLLIGLGRHAEAVYHLEIVARDTPTGTGAMTNLASSLMLLGRAAESRHWHGRSFETTRRPSAWSARLLASNAVSGLEEELLAEEHRTFDALLGIEASPCPRRPGHAQPLRVGFVSADLRRHAVATFIEPVIEHLADHGVEPVAFSNSPQEDEVTRRLQTHFCEWHRIHLLSDERAVGLIRECRIDVLVDLAGHTVNHRLGVFARRAAPVQATWLGYPNTTGVRAMDFRIVDEITDPPGSEGLTTERLLRIPPPFLCYRPWVDRPAPAQPRRPGPPAYGCFNLPGKLSEATLRVWSELLQFDRGSMLLLKQYLSSDPRSAEAIRARFELLGVEGSRVGFVPWTAGPGEHLDAYRDIDVALDPFPYNGTTTTCEAIHAGVPVVTLLGRSHRARVGATILTSIGLGSLVARDESAYIELAMSLRRNSAELDSLRNRLPRLALASPLGDGARFAAEFAKAVRSAFQALHPA